MGLLKLLLLTNFAFVQDVLKLPVHAYFNESFY